MDGRTEWLVALDHGLSRLGPGSAECTLKALALCEDLPAAPEILDVGCGKTWLATELPHSSIRQAGFA